MANLRPRFLQRLLASALLISATPALALQTIEARDGVSVEASIALKEATRIKVDGASITDVFGNIYSSNCGGLAAVNRDVGQPVAAINPTGEIVLECDKDKGEICNHESCIITDIRYLGAARSISRTISSCIRRAYLCGSINPYV